MPNSRCILLAALLALPPIFTIAGPAPASAAVAPAPAADLEAIGQRYMDTLFGLYPGQAVAAGIHKYDGVPPDYSRASLDRFQQQVTAIRAELTADRWASAETDTRLYARALAAAAAGDLFALQGLRNFTRNPMVYAQAIDASIYGKRDFAPKPDRMRSAIRLLNGTSTVVAAAKQNLDQVLASVLIDNAIKVAQGQAEFARGDLLKAFADVKDEELQKQLRAASEAAAGGMEDYIAWLKAERLPKAKTDFAIGREAFAGMLREMELINQSPEEILEIGLKELDRQTKSFEAAAREIDPSRPAKEVWAEVQHDHPTPQTLLPDTRAHLAAIRSFLVEKDLIRFPTPQEVIVDETPAFLRATSFASMDTPGPFETKATEAFYYVTPPERDWDKAKTEEWLTSFNYYTTDVVSIHEALPGHFVQALHLHESSAPAALRCVSSYAFVEGWAHYCEEMGLDEGFPPASLVKDKTTRAKYRMAQASEALLRVCRLVSAIRMHCQGQSLDDATKFFVEHCYYEPTPARTEAERGSYDPGYCLYTVGKLEFLKLRADYKAQEGSAFTLKKFHDEVLRCGQPPVRLLRERLLKDPASWDRTLGRP